MLMRKINTTKSTPTYANAIETCYVPENKNNEVKTKVVVDKNLKDMELDSPGLSENEHENSIDKLPQDYP